MPRKVEHAPGTPGLPAPDRLQMRAAVCAGRFRLRSRGCRGVSACLGPPGRAKCRNHRQSWYFQVVASGLEITVSRASCCVFGLLFRYVQKCLGSQTCYFVVTLMNGFESARYGLFTLLVVSKRERWRQPLADTVPLVSRRPDDLAGRVDDSAEV